MHEADGIVLCYLYLDVVLGLIGWYGVLSDIPAYVKLSVPLSLQLL